MVTGFIIYRIILSTNGIGICLLNSWKNIIDVMKDIKMDMITQSLKESRTREKDEYRYSITKLSTNEAPKEICIINYCQKTCLIKWFGEDIFKDNQGFFGELIDFSGQRIEIREKTIL